MNLKLQHIPDLILETQQSSILSASDSAIKTTSDRISELLLLEDRQSISNNQNQFENLLDQLEREIIIIDNMIEIDQDPNMFQARILQTSQFFHETYQRLISSNNKLRNILENILLLFNDLELKNVIEQIIINKYFNLVVFKYMINLENVHNNSANFFDLSGLKLEKAYLNNKQLLLNQISNSQYVYLNTSICYNFSVSDFLQIFSCLDKVLAINLINNYLRKMDLEQLDSIFSNFNNLFILQLSSNMIGRLNKDGIDIIFNNLSNLLILDLSINDLGKLNFEMLDFLFGYLKSVKYIILENNNLLDDQKEYIKSILPNTILIF